MPKHNGNVRRKNLVVASLTGWLQSDSDDIETCFFYFYFQCVFAVKKIYPAFLLRDSFFTILLPHIAKKAPKPPKNPVKKLVELIQSTLPQFPAQINIRIKPKYCIQWLFFSFISTIRTLHPKV